MRYCRKCAQQISGASKICRQCGGILEEIAEAEVVADRAAAAPRPAVREPERRSVRVAESPPAHARDYARPQAARPKRPPLGLPSGSIRALLTLLVVAVVVFQASRGQPVELLWTETLMIALAHYFTSRRLMNLPPEVVRRLEADGLVEKDVNPLYLPRHSIRAIIILAFAGLAVYLFQKNQLLGSPALPLLGVVAAYLAGIVARAKLAGMEDLKAGLVIVVMAYAAGAYLLERPDLVPDPLRNVTLALVLFYFGSR